MPDAEGLRLCIVSGKGGTGKTTLSVGLACALAESGHRSVKLIDCDVEEPNVHLYLRPQHPRERMVTVMVPSWNRDACDACGLCRKACAYGALALFGEQLEIFSEHCHACGSCSYVCPQQALTERERPVGRLRQQTVAGLDLCWGELNIGEPRGTPVIEAALQTIPAQAQVIIDGPPGTSCALVASVADADIALVVTEPTPFGLHDLALALEVLELLKVPAAVVINKAVEKDAGIEAYCRARGVPVLLRIPFDRKLAQRGAEAQPLTRIAPEWRERLLGLWQQLRTDVVRRRTP